MIIDDDDDDDDANNDRYNAHHMTNDHGNKSQVDQASQSSSQEDTLDTTHALSSNDNPASGTEIETTMESPAPTIPCIKEMTQIDSKFRFLKTPSTNIAPNSSISAKTAVPDTASIDMVDSVEDSTTVMSSHDGSREVDDQRTSFDANVKKQSFVVTEKNLLTSTDSNQLSGATTAINTDTQINLSSSIQTSKSHNNIIHNNNSNVPYTSQATSVSANSKSAKKTATTASAAASTVTKNRKTNMNYKESEFEKVITEPVVNISKLRQLGWNGIPPQHRPQAWKILLGYLPTNETRRIQTLKRKRLEYKDAIKQHYDISDDTRTNSEQETLRQVLVDVPRTAPDVPLFRNDLVRQSLSRLLYIWACRHPASGYVQGINDLATPLIAVFLSEYYDDQQQFFKEGINGIGADRDVENKTKGSFSESIHEGSVLDGSVMDDLSMEDLQDVEADVYWCLTNLLAGIQDHYTSDQPGVQRMVMRLEDLVNRMDGELTHHLRGVGVEFIQFAFRWMNCLLLREFKLECVIRLWDTYLSEGDGAGFAMGFETFHVYVCAAFLCQFSGLLRNMEFDDLFGFMQNVPTSDWGDGEIEILLSQAFVLSTLFHGSDAHLAGLNH
jgi:hypothetical protein